MRLIDADALAKSLEKEREYLINRGLVGAEDVICHHALPLIENAPTIDALKADRPRGEWIGNNLDGTFKVWDCSECGIHMETRWNFCPNCGAKMDGERSEE